jgi:hypothetical protein
MMSSSDVVRLLERSARTSSMAPKPLSERASAKTGGLVHCGLVLQKIDGRAYTIFPENRVLWADREALSKDVADVMIAMSDPFSTTWDALIEQVRVLAASTNVYFARVTPNPARDQFLAEWKLVRALAE